VENEITDIEMIAANWGEGFRKFAKNPRIHFYPDRIEVDLKRSLMTLEGDQTSRITILEPLARDLKMMDRVEGDVTKAAALLSATVGIGDKQVDLIPASDFTLLQQVIGGFLAEGPEISGT
jgi:hypothetical protein